MNPRNLLVLISSASLLLSACATPKATSTQTVAAEEATIVSEGVVYEVTASRLNIREAPNSSGNVAGTLAQGEIVRAPYEDIDGWLYVVSDESGQSGYVSASYLSPMTPDVAAPPPAAPQAAGRAAPQATMSRASGAFANVHEGMSSSEVIEVLGVPDHEQAYITGKSWIPYYYGPDTGRVEFKYAGQGRVVFSRNRYSGQLKVIEVVPDPSEEGR